MVPCMFPPFPWDTLMECPAIQYILNRSCGSSIAINFYWRLHVHCNCLITLPFHIIQNIFPNNFCSVYITVEMLCNLTSEMKGFLSLRYLRTVLVSFQSWYCHVTAISLFCSPVLFLWHPALFLHKLALPSPLSVLLLCYSSSSCEATICLECLLYHQICGQTRLVGVECIGIGLLEYRGFFK